MASLASVLALVETAVEALAGSPVQAGVSDFRTDLQTPMAAGATTYQIQHQHQAQFNRDANAAHNAAAIEVFIHHKLASVGVERTYTEGNMHTQQTSLLVKSFWELTGVKNIETGPQLIADVTRTGNIISWSVGVTFQLVT